MAIHINHLDKNYGKKKVLSNVCLEINEGMYGLLGPNGAGKTTLMRILTTLIPKNQGEIKINDVDISKRKEVRKMVGYLPQDFSMYPKMSVYESLDYLALLSKMTDGEERKQKIDYLLKKVNLDNQRKKKVKALSGGMRRRLGIAAALLNDPQILIVDEPTAGLDPEERIRFRNLLRDFSEDRIVILSTHIVEDVEFTCENLAILNEGKILYAGKTTELLKKAEEKIWTVKVPREELESLRHHHTILSTVSEEDQMKVRILSNVRPGDEALPAKPTIEDAYMCCMEQVG